jgi:hypothetical protein
MEEILGVLAQFLLEVFGQVFLELGFRGLAEVFHEGEARNPALALVGYALYGLTAGGLSLLLFPRSFIRRRSLRIANLLVSPIAAGLVMAALGAYERKQGKAPLRLDSFAYGFVFALGVALIRFAFARVGAP